MRRDAFWRDAMNALPPSHRSRYAGHFERAERFEEVLDALILTGARLKKAAAAWLQSPRASGTHF